MRHPFAVLFLSAVACAPQLDGVCTVDADCGRSDEYCSGGICLRRAGGSSGPVTVDLTAPSTGAQLSRAFRVSARVEGDAEQVTFVVANSATGAPLGQLALTAGAAQTWAGTLTLDAVAFGGAANVRAVAHRSGVPDVASAAVPVVIDQNAPAIVASWSDGWYARDAGLSIAASVSDDRSGVAAAELQLPDGGSYAGRIDGGVATFDVPARDVVAPGAAGAVAFTLAASDVAGNRATVEGGLLHVDDEPPTVSIDPVPASAWFGGPLDVTATIADGAGSGVASAQLLVDGHPAVSDSPAGAAWKFHAGLDQLLPATEGPVKLEVIAADEVGNLGRAEQTIQVDTVAPVVSAVRIDSAPDGTDGAGQGWFSGPTVAPLAGAVIVSAAIADANLVTSGDSAPAAVVGAARFAGSASGGRWRFAIPRSVGLDADGPIMVAFDAQDAAGNHPLVSPPVALYFDDVAGPAFRPSIASDATWYARGAGIRALVQVTYPVMPHSGIASAVLHVAGQADCACTQTRQNAWSCPLASTAAPAGAETAVAFDVLATSVVGASSASSGTRNFDDAAPVISTAPPVPYPAPEGALAWSHDGAHFNVRDSGTLYAFAAWDCGSGVVAPSLLSLSPQPAVRAVKIVASGASHSCANGTAAPVYDVAVTADLSTLPTGALPSADNALSVSVTVADAANDGAGGAVQHSASQTKTVAVTRRLWQTPAAGFDRLALGPALIASSSGAVVALSRANGSPVWTLSSGTVIAPPVVGSAGGSAAIYFGTGLPTKPGVTLLQVAADDGRPLDSCALLARPSASCTGGLRNHWTALALATDGSAVVADDFLVAEGLNGELDCWSAAYMLAHGCSTWVASTLNHNLEAPLIGRGGRVFFVHTQVSATGGPQPSAVQEWTLDGAKNADGPACNALDLLTDDGGGDALACGGGRYAFSGLTFNPLWTGSASPLRTLPGLDLFFSAAGAAYQLSTGAAIQGFNGAGTPLLVDSSASPVLFSASGTALSALHIGAAGYGSSALGLPAVPGSTVDDSLLDRSGTLYVASNGQVSAIATTSPGPAGGMAWVTRGRDNCRSNNLEFACPY